MEKSGKIGGMLMIGELVEKEREEEEEGWMIIREGRGVVRF